MVDSLKDDKLSGYFQIMKIMTATLASIAAFV